VKQKGITHGTYDDKKVRNGSNLSICPTCKKCENKEICRNRKQLRKCDICNDCKDQAHCDKFYFYSYGRAMLTTGKDVDTKRPIRKVFTAPTEEEALEKLYDYKLEIKKSGQDLDFDYKRTDKSIVELGKEIEESKIRKGKTRGNTYLTNMATLKRIEAHKFANIPINKVKKEHIAKFLEDERDKSNSVIKKDFGMLRKIFEYAVDNKYISNNFFLGINLIEKPISNKEDKEVKALSLSEHHRLVDYLNNNPSKYKNVIFLCLFTGMRIGEVLALNYKEDIDMDSKRITVRRTLTKDKNGKTIVGSPKTNNGKRIIQIDELIEPVLKNALDNVIKNKNHVLFCHEDGRLIETNTVNSNLKRVCKNAEIGWNVSIHCLRHSYATRCIEAEVTLPVLQAVMGHGDIQTTINTYGHIYKYLEKKEHQKYVDHITQGRD